MTDLHFRIGETKFALRAALLCVQEEHLLVVGGEHLPFLYLPGGAVQAGETLLDASARKWRQELGHLDGVGECGPLHPTGLVEHFFELRGQAHHELGVYFRMLAPPARWSGRRPLGDDASEWLEWVPLTELAARNVQPQAVGELLTGAGDAFLHCVEGDLAPAAVQETGTDLLVPQGGWQFQVRVHLLCVDEEGVLTNTVPGSGFWFLPGGSVWVGESSTQATVRECREELGLSPLEARLVGLCEGFDWGRRRQQFGLLYRVTPAGDWRSPERVLDHPDQMLEWVPYPEVEARAIHPLGLAPLLAVPPGEVRWLQEMWGTPPAE